MTSLRSPLLLAPPLVYSFISTLLNDFSLLCLEILLTGSIVITFRAQFGQDYLLLVTHQCIAMVSLSFLSTLGKIGTLGKFVFPHLCKFITFVFHMNIEITHDNQIVFTQYFSRYMRNARRQMNRLEVIQGREPIEIEL